MSWFHSEEDYDLRSNDNITYSDVIITSGSGSDSDSAPSSPSGGGGWDDYQREYVSACCQNTR